MNESIFLTGVLEGFQTKLAEAEKEYEAMRAEQIFRAGMLDGYFEKMAAPYYYDPEEEERRERKRTLGTFGTILGLTGAGLLLGNAYSKVTKNQPLQVDTGGKKPFSLGRAGAGLVTLGTLLNAFGGNWGGALITGLAGGLAGSKLGLGAAKGIASLVDKYKNKQTQTQPTATTQQPAASQPEDLTQKYQRVSKELQELRDFYQQLGSLFGGTTAGTTAPAATAGATGTGSKAKVRPSSTLQKLIVQRAGSKQQYRSQANSDVWAGVVKTLVETLGARSGQPQGGGVNVNVSPTISVQPGAVGPMKATSPGHKQPKPSQPSARSSAQPGGTKPQQQPQPAQASGQTPAGPQPQSQPKPQPQPKPSQPATAPEPQQQPARATSATQQTSSSGSQQKPAYSTVRTPDEFQVSLGDALSKAMGQSGTGGGAGNQPPEEKKTEKQSPGQGGTVKTSSIRIGNIEIGPQYLTPLQRYLVLKYLEEQNDIQREIAKDKLKGYELRRLQNLAESLGLLSGAAAFGIAASKISNRYAAVPLGIGAGLMGLAGGLHLARSVVKDPWKERYKLAAYMGLEMLSCAELLRKKQQLLKQAQFAEEPVEMMGMGMADSIIQERRRKRRAERRAARRAFLSSMLTSAAISKAVGQMTGNYLANLGGTLGLVGSSALAFALGHPGLGLSSLATLPILSNVRKLYTPDVKPETLTEQTAKGIATGVKATGKGLAEGGKAIAKGFKWLSEKLTRRTPTQGTSSSTQQPEQPQNPQQP